MKSSLLVHILVGIFAFEFLAEVDAANEVPFPDKDAFYGNLEGQGYIGCFMEKGDFKLMGNDPFMTNALCREWCITPASKVSSPAKYAGTSKNGQCWCGNTLPAKDKIVENGDCDNKCQGYRFEPCGGRKSQLTITIGQGDDPRLYDGDGDGENGLDASDHPDYTPPKSTATSSKQPTSASTVVQDGPTVVVTRPADDSQGDNKDGKDKDGGGLNTAGLAAGVVVGVLVAISAGVGAFIFVRRKKQKQVEQDYRRSVAVMEYGVKKPESDMRLDPVMLQRRMSDGSIADNQDYSRRILKVTNPDGN